MFTAIARFEARYQLRSPLFVVAFALFFLFAFGSVASENIRIGAGGNVHVNAPYAIAQTIAILNLFGLFVVTAFVANVVIRDDETGFAPLVRSTRIGKFDYLIGRFCGAFLAALAVMTAVPLGMLMGSHMPWIDPETLGPTVLQHYGLAFLFFGFPTLLLTAAAFFALATATRSLMWTFIGVIAFLVLFIASRMMLRDPAWDAVSAWTDPFGLSALNQLTRYWTAAERNTQLPAMTGLILYNRLLWAGIGLVFLALAYAIFRFDAGATKQAKKVRGHTSADQATPARGPLPNGSTGERTAMAQCWALARFDVAYVLRSPAFIVLLVLGLFNALAAMTGTVEQRGVEFFPVTRNVITALSGAYNLFTFIIAVFYAGELVWRDRDRRMHEIVGASAAPDWAFMLPKVLAIAGVLLATYIAAVLGGIAFQVTHGYTELELGAYGAWFIAPHLVEAFLLAVLAIFVQTLVPNKFSGWAVMLVFIVSTTVLGNLGFEHNLYNYGSSTAVPLSDMNGAGHFWLGRAWMQLYWCSFAGVLLVFSHLMWRRGVETAILPRLRRLPGRLHGSALAILIGSVIVWVGLGTWVFYNTNVLNRYEVRDDRENLAADMEKQLLGFEGLPQPTIAQVTLDVALYPREQRAITRGSYLLENRSGVALSAVHVQSDPDAQDLELHMQGATLEKEYPRFGYRIYRLDQPLAVGAQRVLHFSNTLQQIGFRNEGNQTRIVANGSFLNNFELAPQLGVNRAAFLQDRAKRRKHGLPAELRPAKLEDAPASAHHYLRHDSDWVQAHITLSTDADQTPVAPGYTVSDTVANGRRTVVTRTEAPIHNFFSLQSARYAVQRDQWKNGQGSPVELAVYFHPPHAHNVRRMLDAMKVSLDVFSEKFSPFQFRQLRVLEFPAYASFAQSFANTVPYSESIGFIQNFKDVSRDTKIDLVTYVTAHEVAHQWWAHQVIGADKQGMTLLSESFAQYSALLVMEKLYGRDQIRKFLKYELDGYLRSRGGEILEELPLYRVENQGYIHYQKGGLAMYALKEEVGEAAVNRALQKLLAEFAFKGAPYPASTDFLRLLRAEVTPAQHGLIADLFEKITLYDLKASAPKVQARSDGKFDVRFTVQAAKFYSDGKGKETAAPLSESFEIGAFSAEPAKKGYGPEAVLALQRVVLHSGSQEVHLVTATPPTFVGVDPFNVRIDRNSNDNLVKADPPGTAP
jgi:ABC-2 type transport system permease protein